MIKDAIISECKQYRYVLSRNWDKEKPILNFIMLNPSTADASEDDPTIRRCINFAQRDGYGGIYVTNMFAFRTPYPRVLYSVLDPFGPENARYVKEVMEKSGMVCAAWGATRILKTVNSAVAPRLEGRKLFCLGKTKDGSPRHPLYVRSDQPFVEFKDRAA